MQRDPYAVPFALILLPTHTHERNSNMGKTTATTESLTFSDRDQLVQSIRDLTDDLDNISENDRVDLYLDPEGDTPAIRISHGEGTPVAAHTGRWMHLLHVPCCTSGVDIVESLCSEYVLDTLFCLTDQYQGVKWNGHNHVGVWSDEATWGCGDPLDLERDRESWATYWDAEEWILASASGYKSDADVCAEIHADLRDGETLTALADRWATDALPHALVRPVDLRDAMAWIIDRTDALPGWVADDGQCEVSYRYAGSGREAAEEYVADGTWGTDGLRETIAVEITVWRRALQVDDDDRVSVVRLDESTHLITIAPDEPACLAADDAQHHWAAPPELVGGCEQNPGVWGGRGCGVTTIKICLLCGLSCTESSASQGYETVHDHGTVEYGGPHDVAIVDLARYHSGVVPDGLLPDSDLAIALEK